MSTALVTGATAGIGESFTRLLAEKGFDLVLVARDNKRLQERAKSLSKKHKVEVEILQADLSVPAQLAKVEKRLSSAKKPIEVLFEGANIDPESLAVTGIDLDHPSTRPPSPAPASPPKPFATAAPTYRAEDASQTIQSWSQRNNARALRASSPRPTDPRQSCLYSDRCPLTH